MGVQRENHHAQCRRVLLSSLGVIYLVLEGDLLNAETLKNLNRGDFLVGVLYLVIFPSWLSYLLWHKGILAIGATRGEVFSHLIPLSGGILSILFLHVPLHFFHLVNVMLITIGIILCSVKQKTAAR